MKLVSRLKRAKEPPRFSGRVKVAVTGIDQHGQLMSRRSGLPAKAFVVSDTTLNEVYAVVRKAVEENCEDESLC